MPYIKVSILVMSILRLPLLVMSYFRPSLCKAFFPYQMVYTTILLTAPIDYGQVQASVVMTHFIWFTLLSYSFVYPFLTQIAI